MIYRLAIIGFIRSEGVDATGLHFHHTVPPVGPGDAEIVDGPPQDTEGLSLQSELRGVGNKPHSPAYSPPPCWHTGEELLVCVTHTMRCICWQWHCVRKQPLT